MAERRSMKDKNFKSGDYRYTLVSDVQKHTFNLMREGDPLVVIRGVKSDALGEPTMRFEPQKPLADFEKVEDRIAIADACILLESMYAEN